MVKHRPGGSHYLTPEAAQRAVALAAPMLECALGDASVVGSGFLYLVIMDPGRRPGECSFEDAVLYERAFGDRQRWDADYAALARAKARLSWRTGLDGAVVQESRPYLLREGDTALRGGVWLNGIVVAVSGAFAAFDEAFAGTVALCLGAVARRGREAEASTRLQVGAGDDA